MTVDPQLTNWLQVGADLAGDDCGPYYARQLLRLRVMRYQRTGPATTLVFWHGDGILAEVTIRDLESATFGGASTYALNLIMALRSRIDPPHLVDWFSPLFAEAWRQGLR